MSSTRGIATIQSGLLVVSGTIVKVLAPEVGVNISGEMPACTKERALPSFACY